MKQIHRALGVGALTLAFVLTGCSAGGAPTGSAPAASSEATTAPESTGSTSTESTSSEANAADEAFVTGMLPHHEQAIEMSDVVLDKDGVDPRVLDLAQRIKDAQGPEIEQLQTWLDDWGVEAEAGHGGGHGAHGGMMSEEDMQALEDADGADASRLFLQQMIVHHEGAVEMAETEVAEGQHPEVVALAQQVIDAQAAEIAEMEQLLTEL